MYAINYQAVNNVELEMNRIVIVIFAAFLILGFYVSCYIIDKAMTHFLE